MPEYVLALDIGTSTCHCLLVDERGRSVAAGDSAINYYTPQGGPMLTREFNPNEIMHTLGQLVRETLSKTDLSGDEVAAIAITSQRQGAVLLDRQGKELYCGPNIDLRGAFEGAMLDERFGDEIYKTTGHAPSLLFAPARMQWFKANEPALFDQARTLLSVAGWLGYRLTGQAGGELGLDCELGLVDVSSKSGSDGALGLKAEAHPTPPRAIPLLNKLDFPTHLLPPLVPCGQPLGQLLPAVAGDWGLRAGVPVTLAGPDSQCGLLGLGMAREGEVGAVLGWSGSIHVLTASPKLDLESRRTWSGAYPPVGAVVALRTAESNLGDVGNAYRWLVMTIGGGLSPSPRGGRSRRGLSYSDADHLASHVSPGCDGVSAFLGAGTTSAPKAGLRMGGILFPTPLSFQEPSPGHIFRAYLESLSYSLKANLVLLSQVTGHSPDCLYVGGGLSQSNLLCSTLADVLGLPIRRSRQPHISGLGAAAVAWPAAGRSSSLQAALPECLVLDTFQPDPSRSASYGDYYRTWRGLYNQVSAPG